MPTKYTPEHPDKNASTTGGPGKRNVDQTGWRKKMQQGRVKFEDDMKQRFLEHFAQNGRMVEAAYHAGVTYNCVYNHLNNDLDFEKAFQEARGLYKDRVIQKAQNLIFDGTQKPILGGRNKDVIVAVEQVEYPNLILAELKKVDPEYTDRQSVEINGGASGVLVAPAGMSPEEWIQQQNKENEGKVKPDSTQNEQST